MSTRLVRAVSFETPEGPPLAQAVSLALSVIKAAKATTWEEVPAIDTASTPVIVSPAGLHINLSLAQADLIAEHAAHFVLISTAAPIMTLAVCPDCDGWTVVAGAGPTKCKTKLGCEGKPVKASAAKKAVPVPVETPDDPILEDADDE